MIRCGTRARTLVGELGQADGWALGERVGGWQDGVDGLLQEHLELQAGPGVDLANQSDVKRTGEQARGLLFGGELA